MPYKKSIVNSDIPFDSGEFKVSLKYAELAIKEKSKKTDGYFCAGKACGSFERPREISEYK